MKKEPSLFRAAIVLVGIFVGVGAIKLGIPQAIAGYFIDYLRDGTNEVTRKQREKLEAGKEQRAPAR